jgi:acetolactate synthase I/II/III large subunit
MRTGAFSLVETAVGAGVQVCFANPGTTEIPIVATVDHVPGLRVVLGLFEGVCAGAADGWGRMTGRPAATLLHLGPGFANGVAHLHNARRARTPVVNWIGEHATGHRAFDTPLSSDIAALTDSVGWTRTVESPREMAEASRAAVEAAVGPPGRVASLIIPADCQWEPGPEPLAPRPLPGRREASASAVREAARLLRTDGGGILVGGDALSVEGLRAAARVTAATGAGVWTETFPSRHERGRGVPGFPALPYFHEQAREALANLSGFRPWRRPSARWRHAAIATAPPAGPFGPRADDDRDRPAGRGTDIRHHHTGTALRNSTASGTSSSRLEGVTAPLGRQPSGSGVGSANPE